MRIGVLEDDPALCVMMQEMLEMGGHTTSLYRDGLALLKVFLLDTSVDSPPPFDLLLVDLILPGALSGEQVIAHVRNRYSTLPIVVISATTPAHVEGVLRSYPGVKALRKPFKLRDLFALIEEEKRSP